MIENTKNDAQYVNRGERLVGLIAVPSGLCVSCMDMVNFLIWNNDTQVL